MRPIAIGGVAWSLCVCLSGCVYVCRKDISIRNHMQYAIFTKCFVHVADGRGLVLDPPASLR